MTTNCVVGRAAVSDEREAAVRRIAGLSVGVLVFASSMFASGLPALTSSPWVLSYGVDEEFTAFAPAGADVHPTGDIVLIGPINTQQLIGLNNPNVTGGGDVCYSTTCPSTTTQYPQPNFVLPLGSIEFVPDDIPPGTGISSASTDFRLEGNTVLPGSPGTSLSASGTPTLYTGEDPGGLTSYLYFVNADNTVTNELHVADNTHGGALIQGVLLDCPPAASPTCPGDTVSLTLDILGFTSPGANSFLTAAPTPEPDTLPIFGMAAAVLAMLQRSRKQPN